MLLRILGVFDIRTVIKMPSTVVQYKVSCLA